MKLKIGVTLEKEQPRTPWQGPPPPWGGDDKSWVIPSTEASLEFMTLLRRAVEIKKKKNRS